MSGAESDATSARCRPASSLALQRTEALVIPEMAVRLSMAFATSAESWLNQQSQYNLWHAEQRRKQLRVVKLASA